MTQSSVVVLLAFLLSLTAVAVPECNIIKGEKKEWWRNAAIYQIYPLSLKDSDNNGKGDIRGIIEKLPYLKETGFDAVWLSPIYASPMVDFGYDISNFTDIHEWYGTMEDFENMTETIHKLGMKLILDLVPNHTSNKHEWFIKSAKRIPGYEDYYVWVDPQGFDDKGKPILPNNWLSVFYGSAWTYNKERNQFYLHQFATQQPDLNYRNPRVVHEMKEIIKFWLNKNVDGFRVDAIPFLFEDALLRDEPESLLPGNDPMDHSYLSHVYTQNLPETYDMVQQWRKIFDDMNAADCGERFFMLEAYCDIKNTMRYFGTSERPGAHFPFNFNILLVNNGTSAQDMKQKINSWLDNVPKIGHSNWVIGNHDQHRLGSRLGVDLIDGMNTLNLLLPGTSITYYGEEIGMIDNDDVTYEEGVDPQGCNFPKEQFKDKSRDFERTPFQWDDTVNAGFNTGGKTWLPLHRNYKKLNLKAQKGNPYSHYAIFKDLLKAKKTKTVQDGRTLLQAVGEDTLALVRGTNSDDLIVVLINFSNEADNMNLNEELFLGRSKLRVLISCEGSGFIKGNEVNISDIRLKGKNFLVLTTD